MNSPHFFPNVAADGAQQPLGASVEPDQALGLLLTGFIDSIVRVCNARAGAIRLFSAEDEALYLGASHGLPQEIVRCESCVPRGCGVCGQALIRDTLCIETSDACAQRHPDPFFEQDCDRVLASPLVFRGNRLGVFTLFLRPGTVLEEPHCLLLIPFAEMVGLSLENARLNLDSQRMTLIAERQAIANEIHDSLSQNLFYGRMRVSLLGEAIASKDQEMIERCLEDVSEALDSGQKSVRELIAHFRSPMDPLGLHHALKMLVDGFKVRSSIIFEYHHPGQHPELTLEQELQVFHILREALNNLVLHSRASHARISVTHQEDRWAFEVIDDGIGLADDHSPAGHYGLTIMRERARRIGANLHFQTAEGVGTRITLELPTTPIDGPLPCP